MRAHPIAATADDLRPGGRLHADGILGVLGFGAPRPEGLGLACPFATVALGPLRPGPAYEVWRTGGAVRWLTEDGVSCGTDGETMFGLVDPEPDGLGMQAVARAAYERMFAAASRLGCPHPIRAYNYLPDILGLERGEERYRLFNAGRQEAFLAQGRSVQAAPAACGLGTRGGRPVIAFVAGAVPGTPVENPRQVSAYRYPAAYGPRSPSFSRAMLAGRLLCISGTASIVGHRSLHADDPAAQTDEIVRNLDALLGRFGETLATAAPRLAAKIYVRHANDLGAILGRLDGLLDAERTMVLEAEICRPDLAVEIEAFCSLA